MDSFLDTCVIVNYSLYNGQEGIMGRCYELIIKTRDFILCYYVAEELNKFITKRAIIYKEVLSKIRKPAHNIGESRESSLLSKPELAYASKLYEKFKSYGFESANRIFLEEKTQIELRIDIFRKRVKEYLIKREEINLHLVNILREFIDKYADCLVLASAMQAQENKEIFLFVTADNHFDPNGYDFIKGDQRLKKFKFPKLKNLLFEK